MGRMIENFGDRMKTYERQETGRRFMPLLPIYARIDGRSFSTFTRGLARPFDADLSRIMVETTKYLVGETNARIGYTQSDEISLAWVQDAPEDGMFFNGVVFKMKSILAAMAAARFNQLCLTVPHLWERAVKHVPAFDCRCFQLPNRIEAANAFLWREQDATKNAITMAARTVYTQKELHGKNGRVMQEMMFQRGVNFNDYPSSFKRGTFVRRQRVSRLLTDAEWLRIPEAHRPPRNTEVSRTEVVSIDMPVFSKVINREAVIFDAAEPMLMAEAA